MRAVIFQGVGDVRVEDVPKPAITAPDQVLLRVTLGAICGSDLHIYHGHSPMEEGQPLGHEFVGIIEEIGAEVSGFKAGDRVVSSFYSACGRCPLCRRGWWAQCENRAIFGFGSYFGGLGGGQSEFCVVPNADVNLARIPDGVADEQAIFVGDILATGYFAAERALINPGDTVAVIGAGPVGLMATMCALLYEPARVYAVDRVDSRLELAEELGAWPINSNQFNPESEIRRSTEGAGADAVIECVGQMDAIELALNCCRGGGTVSSVGVPSEVSGPFPYWDAWTRDLTFRSGVANVHAYMKRLLELIEAGRLHPEKIVSHRMSFEEAPEAYRLFARREASKVLLFAP